MSDLISRQAAIKAIDDLPNCYNGYSDTYDKAFIIGVLEELPRVDVPDRKVGKWIKHKDRTCWYCSECTTDDYYAYTWDYDTNEYKFQDNYCPNCGARMEGRDDDSDKD